MTVDGQAHPKSHRLAGGETIEVDIPSPADLEPEGPPVPVRYADDHLLVVAKPAGLVTHPTVTRRSGTLVNRLLAWACRCRRWAGRCDPGSFIGSTRAHRD